MDKARKMLEKSGWREGTALGKSGDGITTAIKVPLKSNTAGLGFKFGKELTDDWWASAFNASASSLKVSRDDNGIKVMLGETDVKRAKKQAYKDRFKQGCALEDADVEEEKLNENPIKKIKGITCHKAARHGINMTGKLDRIERQEREHLKNTASGSSEEKFASKSSKLD